MDEPNILIKTALNDAVQQVNEGMSPTEALKKVANSLDLNPNYIQRAGEALNVALHYKHFKTASDRSAEFEIADIPKAIEDTFNVSEKTAAEYVSEQFSSGDSNETVFNYNRMLSNPMYKQAFLAIADATETQEYFPTTFNTVYEKSVNHIQKLAKLNEAAQVSKVAAEIDLNASFSSLCDEFKKDAGYRTSFEEFESQVFAKHGEAAVQYLDLLHKTAGGREERGVHDSHYMMFDQCKEARLFDDMLASAETMVSSEKTAEDSSQALEFESSYLKECRVALGKAAAHKVKEKADTHEKSESVSEEKEEHESEDPVIQAIKKKAASTENSVAADHEQDPVLKEAMEKAAFMGGFGNMMSMSGMLTAGPVHDMAHEQMGESVSGAFKPSGAHGAAKGNLTMDNMERKLLLQELMITDPILSKVPPAKVVRAFEQLLRLSPEVSKEKEVVRAELRAMTATQALGRFEADTLTKLDLGMLKRRIATNEFNSGSTEHFRL
jgi:hypothetical protein